jgi:hypothetical protein
MGLLYGRRRGSSRVWLDFARIVSYNILAWIPRVSAVSAALARRHPCQNRIPGCSAVGSAPALGAGCREFESPHSDHTWTSAWRTSWRPPFFESAPVKSGVALFFAPVYPFAH